MEQVFKGLGDRELSVAMLGMVDGNGHPYPKTNMARLLPLPL